MIASLRNDVSLPSGESIIYTHTCKFFYKTIDIGGARWTDISRTRRLDLFPQVQLRVGDMLRVDCFLSVCLSSECWVHSNNNMVIF